MRSGAQNASPGAPWARLWGHGGSGGVRGLFLDDFLVPRGCRGELVWRQFLVFRGMIFPRNFGYVSGGFFHASGSLLDSLEHCFRELSVVIGSGRNGTPACTGATFSMFKRSETRFFLASLSKGLVETISSTFRRILGSAGHLAAPLWAPWGAEFADGFGRDFGCQNDRFLRFPAAQGNRHV